MRGIVQCQKFHIMHWQSTIQKVEICIDKARNVVLSYTTQEDVFSPIFSNLVMNRMLLKLPNKFSKGIAYTDDYVLLIKAPDLLEVITLNIICVFYACKNIFCKNGSKTVYYIKNIAAKSALWLEESSEIKHDCIWHYLEKDGQYTLYIYLLCVQEYLWTNMDIKTYI